MTTANSRWSLF